MNERFDILDTELLIFPTNYEVRDYWFLRDACEGTQIFGSIGSGKTSGSGKAIAKAFLRNGYGGLVLCAKPDERENWQQYARETGREEDVIIFSPEYNAKFNFLQYELSREGAGAGLTDNIANIFMKALEIYESGAKGAESDPFWNRAMMQMLRNAIDVLIPSGLTVGLDQINDLVLSAPSSASEARTKEWKDRSFLFKAIVQGNAHIENGQMPSRARDFNRSAKYWLEEFPNIAPKTRSGIVSTFTSMADGFLRGMMYDLFCTESNIKPEFTQAGAIIILDLPIKEFGKVGTVAQGVFKYMWQQATERRNIKDSPLPVFLYADESQFFTNSYDMEFQTTARSARACTVYLTQNINNYYEMVGSKDAVNSLLGNLRTKIFHSNDDHVTNQWAADTITKDFKSMSSSSHSSGSSDANDGMSPSNSNMSSSRSTSQALHYDVQPNEFLKLRSGGTFNDLEVDAILFKGGRQWGTGKAFRIVTFGQEQ